MLATYTPETYHLSLEYTRDIN